MKQAKRLLTVLCLAAVMIFGAITSTDAFAAEAVTMENLDNGAYLVNVTLEGGTGRATIDSPAVVRVKDGVATADIQWSSENYDYMIVNGEKYLPVNEEGNSLFQIPLEELNVPIAVIADTTAMSTPHEIEYTMTFDATSVKQTNGLTGEDKTKSLTAIIVVVVVLFVYSKRQQARAKKIAVENGADPDEWEKEQRTRTNEGGGIFGALANRQQQQVQEPKVDDRMSRANDFFKKQENQIHDEDEE